MPDAAPWTIPPDIFRLRQPLVGDKPQIDYYRATDTEVTGGSKFLYPAGFPPTNFNSTTVPTVGSLYALPFYSARGGVVSEIGMNVATLAATAVGRLGIYSSDGSVGAKPLSLLLDGGGDLDLSTTGYKFHSISFTMDPTTLYWIALIFGTVAATMTALSGDNPIYGFNTGVSAQFGYLKTGQGYGALPASWPAGGQPTTGSVAEGFVRFSSLTH